MNSDLLSSVNGICCVDLYKLIIQIIVSVFDDMLDVYYRVFLSTQLLDIDCDIFPFSFNINNSKFDS